MRHPLVLSVLSLALCGPLPLSAAKPSPEPAPTAAAQPPASYPLKTCLVSDEPLQSMGNAVSYVHKEAGKPDRVIWVCCEGCIDDFKKEPARYLQKLETAKAKAASAKAK